MTNKTIKLEFLSVWLKCLSKTVKDLKVVNHATKEFTKITNLTNEYNHLSRNAKLSHE